MSDLNNQHRLSPGLPHCIAHDSAGFERLKGILGMNRRSCRDLLESAAVKPHLRSARKDLLRGETKSAPRDRSLLFKLYGDPIFRRAVWTAAYSRLQTGEDQQPSRLIPSFEYLVLDSYVHHAQARPANVREAFAKWRDLQENLEGVEWADLAAHAWDDVGKQLARWGSLDNELRTRLKLVLFAASSIVDDVRLIREAIAQVPELTVEYQNVLGVTEKLGHNVKHSVLDTWVGLCKSLQDLSNTAGGPPPRIEVLDEMRDVLASLTEIEHEVRDHSAPLLLEHLLKHVNGYLRDFDADRGFSWLGTAEIAKIQSMWDSVTESLSLDQIRDEIGRLNDTVPSSVERVRDVATKLSEAEARSASLSQEPPDDLGSRHAWEEEAEEHTRAILDLRGKQREARLALMSHLSPFGLPFELAQSESNLPRSPSGAQHASEPKTPTQSPETTPPPPATADTADNTPPHEAMEFVSSSSCHSGGQSVSDTSTKASDVGPSTTGHPLAHQPATSVKGTEETSRASSSPSSNKEDLVEPVLSTLAPSDPAAATANERITDALIENPPRLTYAVQVSRLITDREQASVSFSAELLEAAALSDRLSTPDGPLAAEVASVLERVTLTFTLPDLDSFARDLHVMLALAATLRPALLSPQTGACGMLSSLKPSDRLNAVYEFSHRVAAASQSLQGVHIDTAVLTGAVSQNAWTAEREQLISDVREWQTNARHATIKYAAATSVWQRWLSQGGLIHQLIDLILSDSRDEHAVQAIVDRLRNRRTFKELVRETDRRHPGSRRREDIHAGALNQLYDRAMQAVMFANRHNGLSASRPEKSNFVTQALKTIRDVLDNFGPPASAELRRIAAEEKSLLQGAASTAGYAIDRFRDLVNCGIDVEPDPKDLLASALLYYPCIALDGSGFPLGDRQSTLKALLTTQPETLSSAFAERLTNGEYEPARRTIEWMEAEEIDDATPLRNRLNEALDQEGRRLRHEIDDTRAMVERALARGHVFPTKRDGHDAVLAAIEHRILVSRKLDYDSERTKIQKVTDDVHQALDGQRETATGTLTSLEVATDSDEHEVVSSLISQGEILAAHEIMDRIRASDSKSLDDQQIEQREVFQEFYPARAAAIEDAMEELPSPHSVVDRIVRGESIADLAFGNIPGAQRNSAARMLKAWFELKRTSQISKEKLTSLFSELGFIVRAVTVQRGDRAVSEAIVETIPLDARERCPIPAFGSFVSGRYRVICLWGRPTEEDILQYAEDTTRRVATFALYFGRLTRPRRENLARLARQRSVTMIALDELLLLYLCGERGSRLPVLFACSIPFTYVQPYVTTAGLVPPEMFYGREQEMREITDRTGACFIYGGRQLGKTALLRAVARSSHAPKKESYAVWIDLKGEGIGYDRTVGDIWPAIWRSLQKHSVISDEIAEPNPNIRNRRLVDKFIDYLCTQFDNSNGRLLLLLLDEADKFLEADGREIDNVPGSGYRESSRLKSLMDRTERSIKVVFAGLHNVLRTVAYSNHPLGHFGQPIQVGPLWRSARALVREPLLAAGYRFKNDNLVARILAQTNYYPNLIQLYGTELIKSMCSRRITGAPLYEIDEDVIDVTYLRNTNLREMIRSRFLMTLQLDPRYEVIAYSIAYECNEHQDILSDGINYRRIDELTRVWWPQGFADIEPSTDRFRSLLDEMEGLGVLRKVDSAKYTLRNPNVLLLMGTAEEIESNLLRTRKLPQGFEPDQFRARDPQASDGPARSPLTYRQEDLLRANAYGVSIVCGLRASGFDNVLHFLEARAASDSVVRLEGISTHREFEDRLHKLQTNRIAGTTIYAIPSSVPWSEKWVELALERVDILRRRGSRDKTVRVLFMADPAHLWELLFALESLNTRGLQWTALRPWSMNYLRQWLEDVGTSGDAYEQVHTHTGGWPLLVERLHMIHQDTGDLDAAIATLRTELGSFQSGFCFLDRGLEMQNRALSGLGRLDEVADFEFLSELAQDEGIDQSTLRKALRWAEALHLVHSVGQDAWLMDTVAAELLRRTNS